MRRIFFILSLLFSAAASAQIFNHKDVLDKFDDVISSRNVKTLIQRNDSAFVIEEKGGKEKVYIVMTKLDEASLGSKDNIVNLVGNVYGYEEVWATILDKDMSKFINEMQAAGEITDKEEQLEKVTYITSKYSYYITHRIITTRYTHDFLREYYFVQKGEGNGRTIYENR